MDEVKPVVKLSKARQINKSRELGVLLNSTLMQRRILYSCLSVLNPVMPDLKGKTKAEVIDWIDENGKSARELRTYRIDVVEFAKVWGIEGANDIKGKINCAIGENPDGSSKIMQLCFKSEIGDKKTFINVMSKVELDYSTGIITVVFTDDILPYLFNLASYTVIPLKATVGFKSNYSFAMLEHLLRRHTGRGEYKTKEFDLEELKAILGATNKSYAQFGSFKRRVLDPITTDFQLISGGGYELTLEPVYAPRRGRGRPQVEKVRVSFNNKGVKEFREIAKAKKSGMPELMGITPDELLSPLGCAQEVKEKRAKLKSIEAAKKNPPKEQSLYGGAPF